ncbi:hypothetical protein Pla108_19330 [Botrimarina colliarenosi]|uniref:Type VI secretion system component TssM1 N-terminal domain-containing protein n=1 Tax=Botrimarina colliarenosi TaxID=2528001 RepID=A0A5C6AFD9_9BACT|nr:type VI secretion protein IcmF/TssM N-terminal domain-containing protein [Botrimarina colliarenosi]TWT97781.1 hypothetical protein Pla108_19330 [Botrimarina colliarenosi]
MIALLKKASLQVFKASVKPQAAGPLGKVLHLGLIAAVLFGLWRLNLALGLDRVVHAPSPYLREFWLPLLFVLAYLLTVVLLATWKAFNEPTAGSPFPDLDAAWRNASGAMLRWGVGLADKPLVLVIGQPASYENDLLATLSITPTFGPTPATSDAPLRVLADDRAVYLVCHEASLLSTCTERLIQRRAARRGRRSTAAPVEATIPAALRVLPNGESGGASVLVEDRRTAEHGSPSDRAESFAPFDDIAGSPLAGRPLLSDDDMARDAGRLGHLLQLIARDRESALPIDAVAAVFPCDALGDIAHDDAIADALRQDLAILGDAGVRCPVAAIGFDLQHVDGAGRLLHALPADRKSRCYGATLPVDRLDSETALQDAIAWVTESMTPTLCRRLFEFEEGDAEEQADNAALHRFQSEVSRRGASLTKVLSRGLEGEDDQPWPCVGAYLLATGDPQGGSQAFGGGVVDTLIDESPRARWTPSAIAADLRLQRLVTAGYATVAAAAGIVVIALVW